MEHGSNSGQMPYMGANSNWTHHFNNWAMALLKTAKVDYLPFLCWELALEIHRDFNIDTEVNASYDFCAAQPENKHNRQYYSNI